MQSSAIQAHQGSPYILGDISQVVKTTNTLSRLVELYQVVNSHPNRGVFLSNLSQIWLQSINELNCGMNLIQIKENLNERFKRLDSSIESSLCKSTMKIQSYYESKISEIDEKDIHNSLNRFFKDTKSLQMKPATRSSSGLNGPTLLVSYQRLNHNRENSQLQNYVVKWSDLTEVSSTRIYDTLSKHFASYENFNSFYVPKLACIDLENKVYEMDNCSKISLNNAITDQLSNTLEKILRSFVPKPKDDEDFQEVEDSRIILMDKVNGSNLKDFIGTKYQHLSELQKKELFTHIGQLAILDLITGNDDRFIQPEYHSDTEDYFLGNGASNLGNDMIVWNGTEKHPTFYAIDNTISWVLIDPESTRKTKYNEFLKEFLAKDDYVGLMAKSVLNSIDEATVIVDYSGITPEYKESVESFRNDLKRIAFGFFCQGIEEMAVQLNDFIKLGNSRLSELDDDDLRNALLERFEIFKLTRK